MFSLIKKLPFEIPEDLSLKINESNDLFYKLDSIRTWVHYNQNITHEKRLAWHKPILELSRENNLLESEAISLMKMAKIHDRMGDFNQSLLANKKAQKIFSQLSLKDNKYYHDLIISHCDISVTYRLQNKFELALETLYDGYEIIKNSNDDHLSALIILSSDLGIIYEKIKDYPAALSMFERALDSIGKSDDIDSFNEIKIICHINIGNIYKLTKQDKAACKAYTEAVRMTNQHNEFYQHKIIANINLGQILCNMEKYDKAIQLYKKVLPICKKSGSDMDLGFIYVLLSEAYLGKNNFKDYDHCILKGKDKVMDAQYPNDMLYLNNIISQYHLKKKEYDKAIKLYEDSISLANEHKMNNHLLSLYKFLFELYEKIGDVKKALKFSKKYIICKDMINEEEQKIFLNVKQQSLNRMQDEIELIKQKDEKIFLETELKYKNREITSKKLHSASNREFMLKLLNALEKIPHSDTKLKDIIEFCHDYMDGFSTWKEYLNSYEQSNPNFMKAIKQLSDKLSITEIRVCSLIHLGLDNHEMAELMSISKRSIEQHRYRIKKKLEINVNLSEYLLSLA